MLQVATPHIYSAGHSVDDAAYFCDEKSQLQHIVCYDYCVFQLLWHGLGNNLFMPASFYLYWLSIGGVSCQRYQPCQEQCGREVCLPLNVVNYK